MIIRSNAAGKRFRRRPGYERGKEMSEKPNFRKPVPEGVIEHVGIKRDLCRLSAAESFGSTATAF